MKSASKMENKLLLTEAETANLLGLCPRSLYSLRKRGDIPFVEIGKSIRYSVSHLNEWIDQKLKLAVQVTN